MLGDEHPDGLTHSQQTDQDLWRVSAVTAVSAVAAAAEMVENEPSRLGRWNAERQRSRGQVKRWSSIQTQHDS